MKAKTKESEHDIQCAFVKWFRMWHPKLLIFAIPNGGHRHFLTAVKLKNEGALAGIPDLLVATEKGAFFIEMKTTKGRLSSQQILVKEKLNGLGYDVLVCRGLYEAIDLTTKKINQMQAAND